MNTTMKSINKAVSVIVILSFVVSSLPAFAAVPESQNRTTRAAFKPAALPISGQGARMAIVSSLPAYTGRLFRSSQNDQVFILGRNTPGGDRQSLYFGVMNLSSGKLTKTFLSGREITYVNYSMSPNERYFASPNFVSGGMLIYDTVTGKKTSFPTPYHLPSNPGRAGDHFESLNGIQVLNNGNVAVLFDEKTLGEAPPCPHPQDGRRAACPSSPKKLIKRILRIVGPDGSEKQSLSFLESSDPNGDLILNGHTPQFDMEIGSNGSETLYAAYVEGATNALIRQTFTRQAGSTGFKLGRYDAAKIGGASSFARIKGSDRFLVVVGGQQDETKVVNMVTGKTEAVLPGRYSKYTGPSQPANSVRDPRTGQQKDLIVLEEESTTSSWFEPVVIYGDRRAKLTPLLQSLIGSPITKFTIWDQIIQKDKNGRDVVVINFGAFGANDRAMDVYNNFTASLDLKYFLDKLNLS